MPPPFQAFGISHLVALILILGLPMAAAALLRHQRTGPASRLLAWFFAGLILLNRLAYLAFDLASGGANWLDQIPIHVCDVVGITTICALLFRNDRCFEVAYFWGLAGTAQALVTPDLVQGYPDPRFFMFFVGHGAIVGGILFGALGLRLRIEPRSILRATLWLYAYAVIIGTIDGLLGVNYGYLCGKPEVPSLLDLLGPWPVYIVILAVMAPILFSALYLPYLIAERLRR